MLAISKVRPPVPGHEVSSKLFKALLFELSNVENSAETKQINTLLLCFLEISDCNNLSWNCNF